MGRMRLAGLVDGDDKKSVNWVDIVYLARISDTQQDTNVQVADVVELKGLYGMIMRPWISCRIDSGGIHTVTLSVI